MYLFIFKDGSVTKNPYELTEDDKNAQADGFMVVVNISDPGNPERLTAMGAWEDIKEIN